MAAVFDAYLGQQEAGAGTTVTITTIADVAAGALIEVGVVWTGVSATVSSTSGGLTWTMDARFDGTTTTSVARLSAPCPAGLAAGSTITVTLSASANGVFAQAWSYLGVDLSDQRVVGSSGGTFSGAKWTATSILPTHDCHISAQAYNNNAPALTHDPDPMWPEIASEFSAPTAGVTLVAISRRDGKPGVPFAASGTWSVSATIRYLVVAYADSGVSDAAETAKDFAPATFGPF